MLTLDNIRYIVSNSGSITVYLANGKVFDVDVTHPSYKDVLEALREKDSAKVVKLLDIPAVIRDFSGNAVEVKGGVVYYKGEALHNTLTDRILAMANLGLDFSPMTKFLENLMENPSYRARQELYDFLANKSMPITDDGCFLAYKSVQANYLDKYSGKFDNHPGAVMEMERGKVDDNRAQECSFGFHVGAHEYSGPGGWYNSLGDKVIIVKVNPRDAVSVPQDHNAQKLRVCRYEVVRDYSKELGDGPVYVADGSSPLSSKSYEASTYCGQNYATCGCDDDDDYDDDDSWLDDEDDDDDDDWDSDDDDDWGDDDDDSDTDW